MEEVKTKWTRGGYRPGSGRKQKFTSGKPVTISFCCSQEQAEQLRKDTKKSGLNRSDYIISKLF